MAKSFDAGNGLRIKAGNLDKLVADVLLLADVEVLVGFPEETTERDPDAESKGITNAALGYIHDNGMPEQNIPARPFMEPGIKDAQDAITDKLSQVLRAASQGRGAGVVETGMHQVGLIAKLAIQNKINEGIPPPLADSTLRQRARKGSKGAKAELARRAEGNAPSMAAAKPLIDTAQMRNAVNYVIRSRKKRSK